MVRRKCIDKQIRFDIITVLLLRQQNIRLLSSMDRINPS